MPLRSPARAILACLALAGSAALAPARADGLLTVILVCPAHLAPSDCTRESALDLVIQPAASPVACLMGGETTVAGGALGRDRAPDTYLKIGCERRRGSQS